MTFLLVAVLAMVVVPPAHAQLIDTAQEIQIGRQVAAEIESRYGLVHHRAWQYKVDTVGLRLARVSDRPSLPWTFRILNSREVNAISLPGGIIYVTKGLMGFIQQEDELGFVLGHEVGHVSRRHHVQLLERDFYFSLVLQYLFGNQPGIGQIADYANALLTRGFNRDLEFEADRYGVLFAHRAGFNAAMAVPLMERFRHAEARDPSQFETLFRTHPAWVDRLARVKIQLRDLGYRVSEVEPVGPPRDVKMHGDELQLIFAGAA
jgi:predicted Zn-dependent protease